MSRSAARKGQQHINELIPSCINIFFVQAKRNSLTPISKAVALENATAEQKVNYIIDKIFSLMNSSLRVFSLSLLKRGEIPLHPSQKQQRWRMRLQSRKVNYIIDKYSLRASIFISLFQRSDSSNHPPYGQRSERRIPQNDKVKHMLMR